MFQEATLSHVFTYTKQSKKSTFSIYINAGNLCFFNVLLPLFAIIAVEYKKILNRGFDTSSSLKICCFIIFLFFWNPFFVFGSFCSKFMCVNSLHWITKNIWMRNLFLGAFRAVVKLSCSPFLFVLPKIDSFAFVLVWIFPQSQIHAFSSKEKGF